LPGTGAPESAAAIFARFCRDIAAAKRAAGHGTGDSQRQLGQTLIFFKYILLMPMKLQLLFDLDRASGLIVLPISNQLRR